MSPYTSVPVLSPDTSALMAVRQSQLERAIYDIKRGVNVSSLEGVSEDIKDAIKLFIGTCVISFPFLLTSGQV